jgi:hypothetical protein
MTRANPRTASQSRTSHRRRINRTSAHAAHELTVSLMHTSRSGSGTLSFLCLPDLLHVSKPVRADHTPDQRVPVRVELQLAGAVHERAGYQEQRSWCVTKCKHVPRVETLGYDPIASPGLERFHNSRALSSIVRGGIFFHPSDEELSLGIPAGNRD